MKTRAAADFLAKDFKRKSLLKRCVEFPVLWEVGTSVWHEKALHKSSCTLKNDPTASHSVVSRHFPSFSRRTRFIGNWNTDPMGRHDVRNIYKHLWLPVCMCRSGRSHWFPPQYTLQIPGYHWIMILVACEAMFGNVLFLAAWKLMCWCVFFIQGHVFFSLLLMDGSSVARTIWLNGLSSRTAAKAYSNLSPFFASTCLTSCETWVRFLLIATQPGFRCWLN